jgi:hypothetical protein
MRAGVGGGERLAEGPDRCWPWRRGAGSRARLLCFCRGVVLLREEAEAK